MFFFKYQKPVPVPFPIFSASRWSFSKQCGRNYRKTLLLAWMGPEPLKIVRNHFRPGEVNDQAYDDVKAALRNYYKPKVTVFSARIDFMKRKRQDGESFGQYANVLRELADATNYAAAAIDSQLRDRFAAGVRHEKVEIEIRQRWPDGLEGANDVTFEQVFRLAEAMERAENECARGRVEEPVLVKKTHRPKRGERKFDEERSNSKHLCGNCRRPWHEDKSECPALGKTCRKCGREDHFARVCRGGTQKEKNHRQRKVKQLYEGSDASDDEVRSSGSSSGDSYRGSQYRTIRKVGSAPKRAVVRTKINGRRLTMDFDTGALKTTVSVKTWKKLGSPRLHRTKALCVYGGKPIELLGETTVDVEAFGQLRVLKMVVANVDDVPLFGSDWAEAFGVLREMKKLGLELKRRHPEESGKSPTNLLGAPRLHSEEVQDLMKEYKSSFSGEGIPDGPWKRVHIGFAGPLEEKMLFILIDAYSKWMEVKVMKKATSAKVIYVLTKWFSRFGAPLQIVSDNRPQFISEEFAKFCKRWGIAHIRTTPYHPKRNDLAERFVQTLKHRLSASEEGSFDERLQSVLMANRMTPLKTTGMSTAELFLNRRLPNLLDRLKPNPRHQVQTEVTRQQVDHDQNAAACEFVPGAPVWVQNEQTSGCNEGTVQRQSATHSYEVVVNGNTKRKHADQLRDRIIPMEPAVVTTKVEEPATSTMPPQPVQDSDIFAAPPLVEAQSIGPTVRRSTRTRKAPVRYGYDPPKTKKIKKISGRSQTMHS